MLTTEQELSPDKKPFPFSVLMLEQINKIRLLKRLRKLKREGKINEINELISRNPGLEDFNQNSVKALSTSLTETRKKLKLMQEEADEIQETHHDKVYKKAAELHNKDKIPVIKEMKERERQSRRYKKIICTLSTSIPNHY